MPALYMYALVGSQLSFGVYTHVPGMCVCVRERESLIAHASKLANSLYFVTLCCVFILIAGK